MQFIYDLSAEYELQNKIDEWWLFNWLYGNNRNHHETNVWFYSVIGKAVEYDGIDAFDISYRMHICAIGIIS